MAAFGRGDYVPVAGAEDMVEVLEDGRRMSRSPLQASLGGHHRVSFMWTDKSQTWEADIRRRRRQLLRGVSLGLTAVAMVALCVILLREHPQQPYSAVQVASKSTLAASADEARAIRAGYLRAGLSVPRTEEAPRSVSTHSRAESVQRKRAETQTQNAGKGSRLHAHPGGHKRAGISKNATRTTALYRAKRGTYDPRTGVFFAQALLVGLSLQQASISFCS